MSQSDGWAPCVPEIFDRIHSRRSVRSWDMESHIRPKERQMTICQGV